MGCRRPDCETKLEWGAPHLSRISKHRQIQSCTTGDLVAGLFHKEESNVESISRPDRPNGPVKMGLNLRMPNSQPPRPVFWGSVHMIDSDKLAISPRTHLN